MLSKLIIYSDFDNTITNFDILDKIITDIYSYETYKKMEQLLLLDELKYETYLFNMFEGIEYNFDNITNNAVDQYFRDFYNWVQKNNIQFFVISSGFKKIIRHLIPYVEDNIIFANDIAIQKDNKWNVELYDKQNDRSINKLDVIKHTNQQGYKTVFIGDGLSDFKVVGKVDVLFCKKNTLLHQKCIDENYQHIVFNDFNDILEKLNVILDEKKV
jgi:2,3-diketo-5-methylthio-1-phosphopentane phosphatase